MAERGLTVDEVEPVGRRRESAPHPGQTAMGLFAELGGWSKELALGIGTQAPALTIPPWPHAGQGILAYSP